MEWKWKMEKLCKIMNSWDFSMIFHVHGLIFCGLQGLESLFLMMYFLFGSMFDQKVKKISKYLENLNS